MAGRMSREVETSIIENFGLKYWFERLQNFFLSKFSISVCHEIQENLSLQSNLKEITQIIFFSQQYHLLWQKRKLWEVIEQSKTSKMDSEFNIYLSSETESTESSSSTINSNQWCGWCRERLGEIEDSYSDFLRHHNNNECPFCNSDTLSKLKQFFKKIIFLN